jgi:ubiquinone/menaquinone biosynthesis C-methylase UbiE
MEVPDYLKLAVASLDLGSDSEVLDVAAGTGLLFRAVSPRVGRVVALDITPQDAGRGTRRGRSGRDHQHSVRAGVAEDLPYPDAAFDVVVTRFSVHHFRSPRSRAG